MSGIRHNVFCKIKDWEKLSTVVQRGEIALNRGNVIPKFGFSKEFCYPVYSSSIQNNGLMGYYNSYMFDRPLISWSIDGGGNFFYRSKHKFNITNVCGIMQVDENIYDYQFLAESLIYQHKKMKFNYQTKAHPSVIIDLYSVPKTNLTEQKQYNNVFYSISSKLIIEEQILNELKKQKQYLLQQMFI